MKCISAGIEKLTQEFRNLSNPPEPREHWFLLSSNESEKPGGNMAMTMSSAESSIGETCSSPDMLDSRKRPLDADTENETTKRSHYGSGDGTYHLKILVPSVAAGAIIGKGGETIAQLQKDTGTRVKMSKANDFYPGTTERVCLISGSSEAIADVLVFIMEKIKEKPDPNAKTAIDFDNKTTAEREKQVKILVPNSTAGMIIGKGGSYIKQIKEESCAYVQISQKAKDQTLQERCITVIGEMENNKEACQMILAKIVEDPQSGSCLNVSYADVQGPVANFNPTGSPYANTSSSPSCGSLQNGSSNGFPSSASGSYTNGSTAVPPTNLVNNTLSASINLTGLPQSHNPALVAQLTDHVKVTMRANGFSEQVGTEVAAAVNTLATYGLLNVAFQAPRMTASSPTPGGSPFKPTSGLTVNVNPTLDAPTPSTNGVFGAIGEVVGPNLNAGLPGGGGNSPPRDRYGDASPPYDPFRRPSPTGPPSPTLPVNNNSYGLCTQQPSLVCKSPTPDLKSGDVKKVDMEVCDNIVGAILGHGGKALVEIQQMSGANIQISKKGAFVPGTRNRIVSIAGTVTSINMAQYLIDQRISEEEAKRARQNVLSVLQ